MDQMIDDGNFIGRIGAVALLAAAGFGLHRLNCGAGMCPIMRTDSCCAGAEGRAKDAASGSPFAPPAAAPAD